MSVKKCFLILFLLSAVCSFLKSQDVVELSKKERQRRAGFKGPRIVVTNKDLGQLKKKPALAVAEQDQATDQRATESWNPSQDNGVSSREANQPDSVEPMSEEGSASGAESQAELSNQEFQRQKSSYEERWNSAQERVDLLTIKMNALWQQFYNMDDMTSRDLVERQISETYNKLLKAQEEATQAKEELDNFIASTPREGVPPLWIH